MRPDMRIPLVSTRDCIPHPVPSRHHCTVVDVSRAPVRETRRRVREATRFVVESPLLHAALDGSFALDEAFVPGGTGRSRSSLRRFGAIHK